MQSIFYFFVIDLNEVLQNLQTDKTKLKNCFFKTYTKITVHFPFLIRKSQTRPPNKANGANNRGTEWRAPSVIFTVAAHGAACAQHPSTRLSTSLSANHSLTSRVGLTTPLSTIWLPVITVVCPHKDSFHRDEYCCSRSRYGYVYLPLPLSGPASKVRLLERSCNLLWDGFSLNWMRCLWESNCFGSGHQLVVPVYLYKLTDL